MSKDSITLLMLLLYAVVIIAMLVFFFWLVIQRKKNTEAMRKNIISKLSSDIELSAKDVVHIGKGFDLTSHRARQVIYKIYSDASSKDEFSKLKKLVTEIETEEPFDDLPDEVKPSMVRLTKITEKTGEESDKYLLSPIAQTLNKYVELKCDQEKLKKQTNRAYLVTVISFIFGSVGAYFSITAPSASDIAEEMRKQNEVINESKT